MDMLESRLREEFDRPPGPVAAAAGIAGARRIRRRRATWHAALSGSAVAAAVVGVVAAVAAVAPSTPAAVPVPASIDWARYQQAIARAPVGPQPAYFVGASDGYGEFRPCAGCDRQLRRTRDGGRTWQPVTLPAGATLGPETFLRVYDADRLLVMPAVRYFDGGPGTAPAGWASADGGRTWTVTAERPIATSAHIPPGARLSVAVPVHDGDVRPIAVEPDGRVTLVTSLPHNLSGFTDPTGVPMYAFTTDAMPMVSVDHGRHWQAPAMPVDWDTTLPNLLGAAGDRQYAFAQPSTVDGADQVLTSTDAGRHWTAQPVPTPTPVIVAPGTEGRCDPATAAMTPGGLLFNDGARTWRYPPGSTVAVPADQPFGIIGLVQVGPNAVAYSADLRQKNPVVRVYLTDDGTHWQPVDWR